MFRRLGSFVHYMRFYVKSGKLAQDRIDRLNELGFSWNVNADRWTAKYEDAAKYKADHGNFNVPYGNPLYHWVGYQRKLYHEGKLPGDHVELLEKLDFDWGSPEPKRSPNKPKAAALKLGVLKVPQLEQVDRETYLEDLWEKSYTELAAYKDHFGHCNIPINYDANPSLGAWAFSQRMAHKKDKLSQDRIDKLNELGFSFGSGK